MQMFKEQNTTEAPADVRIELYHLPTRFIIITVGVERVLIIIGYVHEFYDFSCEKKGYKTRLDHLHVTGRFEL